jgi:AraC-like DNA-binding protein
MEMYSTLGLPASRRMTAWHDLYSTRMSQVEFTPADRHSFDAELRFGELGPVQLARLTVDRCSVERSRSHIVKNPKRLYSFLLQAKGSSTFHHCGNQASLSEGDFVLCDTGLPHFFETEGSSVTIMVRVFPNMLREYLPSPERFRGLRLGRAVGLTGTVGAMVQTLCDQTETGLNSVQEERVARYLLEMISMSYSTGFEPEAKGSAVLWQHRNEILRYIEDNLRDPSLSPASIAAGLRLSSRYLRTIFAVSGEKVSAYVLRRRLEECARQMRNPAWKGHTLTEIAFSWGFNSAAHFTRCFRDQFNVAPREYRRAALG